MRFTETFYVFELSYKIQIYYYFMYRVVGDDLGGYYNKGEHLIITARLKLIIRLRH